MTSMPLPETTSSETVEAMPLDPIDFCPAAACAAAIVRLEGFVDHVARLHEEAKMAGSPELMKQLEAISDELILAADEARGRLAHVEAVSSVGAMAQLFAAIRDVRVRDAAETERAKDLEARAIRFLSSAGLYDASFCRSLSGTRLGGRMHTPPRAQPIQMSSR